jgi:hypothetical protein
VPSGKIPGAGRPKKASNAQTMLRTMEILRIRLAGAKEWDVSLHVRKQEQTEGSPWKLAEGETPLSARQVRRYIAQADALIRESTRESRKHSLRKHLAQRGHLFALALQQGDVRAALAVAQDEARLRNLYPLTRIAPTTPDGKDPWTLWAPALKDLSDEELAVLAKLAERGRQAKEEPKT